MNIKRIKTCELRTGDVVWFQHDAYDHRMMIIGIINDKTVVDFRLQDIRRLTVLSCKGSINTMTWVTCFGQWYVTR